MNILVLIKLVPDLVVDPQFSSNDVIAPILRDEKIIYRRALWQIGHDVFINLVLAQVRLVHC